MELGQTIITRGGGLRHGPLYLPSSGGRDDLRGRVGEDEEEGEGGGGGVPRRARSAATGGPRDFLFNAGQLAEIRAAWVTLIHVA